MAEVGPEWDVVCSEILMQHRNDADREISRDPTGDLEESERGSWSGGGVPVRQFHHVLNPGPDDVDVLDVPLEAVGGKNIAGGAVLPAGNKEGEILFAGGDEPTVDWIDLVVGGEGSAAEDAIEKLVREVATPLDRKSVV